MTSIANRRSPTGRTRQTQVTRPSRAVRPARAKKQRQGERIGRFHHDGGQATAEYALVMLAAAAIAGSVLAWAVGTGAIARLMDAVIESLIGQV